MTILIHMLPMLKKYLLLPMLVLALVAGAGSMAIAQNDIPAQPQPKRIINDMAGILDPAVVQALEQDIRIFEDSTSNQISVVTVTTLNDYEVGDFAQRLGQKWGIGKKERNNGVLLLIAPNERKVSIQVGYGLEGPLPDHVADRIIRNTLKPYFKAGDYSGGVQAAVQEIKARIKGEYKNDAPLKHGKRKRNWAAIIMVFSFVVAVIIALIFIIIKKGGGGNNGGWGDYNPRPRGRYRDFTMSGGPFIFGGGFGSGRGFGGGGGLGGGGGGWGGFGGGSFGGGGASGSW